MSYSVGTCRSFVRFWVLFLAGRSTPDLIVFTFLAAKQKYRDVLWLNICRKKAHVRCYDVTTPIQSIALSRVEVTDFGINTWTHMTAISS